MSKAKKSEFRSTAPSAEAVFYRSYSRRKPDGSRESFKEAMARAVNGIAEVGNASQAHLDLMTEQAMAQHTFPSGRAFWVAGSAWSKQQPNFSGAYNCTSTNITDLQAFGLMMDLAMQGSGTGAVLEKDMIEQLPTARNRIEFIEVRPIGEKGGNPHTNVLNKGDHCILQVGDSRQGWVDAYQGLINAAFSEEQFDDDTVRVVLDLSNVRPAGERLKGFGGTANPVKLEEMFRKVADLLNGCQGRKMTSVEACLLIDEAASCVVAGNIRRCLPAGTMVHTENGLVPIEKVQVGDRVQTPTGFRRVTAKFDQGEQEVLELSTNSMAVRATAKHRVAVLSDATGGYTWKMVEELEPEDRLLHNTLLLPGAGTELPADTTGKRSNMSRAKDITVPALDRDIAWLIGYTHGNGYVSLGTNLNGKPYGNITWAFNSTQTALAERIKNRISRAVAKFGVDVSYQELATENTARVRCCSIRLTEYFYEHIKQPKTSMTVPEFILKGSAEIRASYLAGIVDSDGAVNNRPPHLVTTVYREFARQLGAVLSSLGIPGRTSVFAPKEENWSVKHSITIPAFKGRYNQIIAPHSEKGPLKEGNKAHGFTVPNKLMRQTYSYSEMRDMGFNGSPSLTTNVESYLERAGVDLDVPVTFLGVASCDVLPTFDIEVEEAHCFYADGYLTHNSAGMRQFSSDDQEAIHAKEGLYSQDEEGNWRVDPKKEALRMANHTICYHHKPTLEEVKASVTKQFYSGEGAIQYVPEALARANVDLLPTAYAKDKFIRLYEGYGKQAAKNFLYAQANAMRSEKLDERELSHRCARYGLNPCGEILGSGFHCNLSEVHLNTLDPTDKDAQYRAFYAGGLQVATLLKHVFYHERYRYSREIDPIVGVSFTGMFDFFVHAFGSDWLAWMMNDRPDTEQGKEFVAAEAEYFKLWRKGAWDGVYDFCSEHNMRTPNRVTTVQPAGTKSLLTGASSGWHPPKAQRFIRRITFGKQDPLVSALRDWGYSVVPAPSARDDEGNLLDDIADPRVQEVLVEIPTEVSWANIPGADQYDLSKLSAAAQFKLYHQVQTHYTDHNTSATIEFREHEIDELSELIHEHIGKGYISAALLARFDANATFPRLPFEPITKEKYDELIEAVNAWRLPEDEELGFLGVLAKYDRKDYELVTEAACTSAACIARAEKDEQEGKA